MSRQDLGAFLEDRRRSLSSDDPEVWRAYFGRCSVPVPPDPEMLRRTVDKARTGARELPLPIRQAAARRLRAVGWTPFDDGELS